MKRFRFLMVRAGVVGFRDERRRLRPIRFIRLGIACRERERERSSIIPSIYSRAILFISTASCMHEDPLRLLRCASRFRALRWSCEQDIMMWQSKLKCSHSNSGAALMCVNILAGNSPNLSLYRLCLFSWIHPFTNPLLAGVYFEAYIVDCINFVVHIIFPFLQ